MFDERGMHLFRGLCPVKFIIRKIIFLVVVTFSPNLFVNDSVELFLTSAANGSGGLMVFLFNNAEEEILVSKRLAIGSQYGPNELSLIVKSSEGDVSPFLAKVKLLPASEDDMYLLKPDEFVGKNITYESLVKYYGLGKGVYEIQAIYKNHYLVPEVYNGKLYSNKLEIDLN